MNPPRKTVPSKRRASRRRSARPSDGARAAAIAAGLVGLAAVATLSALILRPVPAPSAASIAVAPPSVDAAAAVPGPSADASVAVAVATAAADATDATDAAEATEAAEAARLPLSDPLRPDEAAPAANAGSVVPAASAPADATPAAAEPAVPAPPRPAPSPAAAKPAAAVAKSAAGVAKPAAGVAKPAAGVAKPAAGVAKPTAAVAKPTAAVAKPTAAVAKPAAAPVRTVRRLVFVIDDAGYSLDQLDAFLGLPMPLTIAVLPGLPHSAEAARRIRAAGKEAILHQPMEAVNGQDPGPGAIDSTMDAAAIKALLLRNVGEVGPVAGMNNHQGSKTTADPQAMAAVLAFCRDNGLYFLDSRTTADTVVSALAARLGTTTRERDVFVDNIQERAAMIRYVQDGLAKADKQGAAVMIGHVWSAGLADTLRELYPELIEQGYSLATVSKIMLGTLDDEDTRD